jgi:hypothetical protein
MYHLLNIKNTFYLFCCLLCLGCLFSSCEKEYSTEYGQFTKGTNSGTAVYSYVNTTNSCTNAVVKGTYTAGAAVTIANSVTLQVTVTSPGSFIISTATINGVTFKGSGSFSMPGVQNLNLLAVGTPLSAGTFTYVPGSNGCAFEVVFLQGSASTSEFTFKDAPNACSQVTVNGTYLAGETVGTANTVEGIQVNVTKTGTWYLSTLPNNGITFSGSGTFTTTGLQTISLNASGTPITSGAFNYSPGNNGCSFSIVVQPGISLPTDYIKCKINDVTTVFGQNVSFTELNTPAQPPVPATYSINMTGDVSATSDETIELSVTKTSTSIINGDIFDINSLLSGKIYTVSYTDPGMMAWNAVAGISFTPFSIKITSRTATRVQGTFSGTVSDTGLAGGTTKTITDGSFSVPVQ